MSPVYSIPQLKSQNHLSKFNMEYPVAPIILKVLRGLQILIGIIVIGLCGYFIHGAATDEINLGLANVCIFLR
jgi:hypothetical protein